MKVITGKSPLSKAVTALIGLFVVAMAVITPSVLAADLKLYEATVPVTDQSTETRVRALQAAMANVLVRITGDRAVASTNAGQRILRRAPQFVQQYRYERRAVPLGEFGPISDEMVLSTQFDSNALNSAVRDAKLPLWGQERPTTLVWVLIRDEAGYRLAADNSRERDALKRMAAERGLALLMPPAAVTIRPTGPSKNEIDAALLSASAGYRSNKVVRVFVDAASGAARWRELNGQSGSQFGGQRQGDSWVSNGGSRALAISNGGHALADKYAERFAVAKSGVGTGEALLLQVSGVRSLRAYAELGRHLESITVITGQQLHAAGNDTVSYKLLLDGDAELLKAALSLGRLLQPSQAPVLKVTSPTVSLPKDTSQQAIVESVFSPLPSPQVPGSQVSSSQVSSSQVSSSQVLGPQTAVEPKSPDASLPVLYYRFGSL